MSDLKKGKGRRSASVSLQSEDDTTVVGHSDVNVTPPISKIDNIDDRRGSDPDVASSISGRTSMDLNRAGEQGRLHRGLSARQVQMIAIAGKRTQSVPKSIRAG